MSCNDKIIIEITELNDVVNIEIQETCDTVTLVIEDVGTAGQDAINYIRRHDFVTNVSYCGYAKRLSEEDASVWNISKIVVSVEGSTTITRATNVNWTEHLTHSYT